MSTTKRQKTMPFHKFIARSANYGFKPGDRVIIDDEIRECRRYGWFRVNAKPTPDMLRIVG